MPGERSARILPPLPLDRPQKVEAPSQRKRISKTDKRIINEARSELAQRLDALTLRKRQESAAQEKANMEEIRRNLKARGDARETRRKEPARREELRRAPKSVAGLTEEPPSLFELEKHTKTTIAETKKQEGLAWRRRSILKQLENEYGLLEDDLISGDWKDALPEKAAFGKRLVGAFRSMVGAPRDAYLAKLVEEWKKTIPEVEPEQEVIEELSQDLLEEEPEAPSSVTPLPKPLGRIPSLSSTPGIRSGVESSMARTNIPRYDSPLKTREVTARPESIFSMLRGQFNQRIKRWQEIKEVITKAEDVPLKNLAQLGSWLEQTHADMDRMRSTDPGVEKYLPLPEYAKLKQLHDDLEAFATAEDLSEHIELEEPEALPIPLVKKLGTKKEFRMSPEQQHLLDVDEYNALWDETTRKAMQKFKIKSVIGSNGLIRNGIVIPPRLVELHNTIKTYNTKTGHSPKENLQDVLDQTILFLASNKAKNVG
ncbi:MAG: hypothetical protein WCV84_03835 [Patescibacteria group bacterium]